MSPGNSHSAAFACEDDKLVGYTNSDNGNNADNYLANEYQIFDCTAIVPPQWRDTWFLLHHAQIYKSTDYGVTWYYVSMPTSQYAGEDITYTAIVTDYLEINRHIAVHTDTYSLMQYSSDSGVSFHDSDLILTRNPENDNVIVSVFMGDSSQFIYVATSNGEVYISSNFGRNYTVNSPVSSAFHWQQIAADTSGMHVFVGGYTDSTTDEESEYGAFVGVLQPFAPSMAPTQAPTFSQAPSAAPTFSQAPSESPTQAPSLVPSEVPSESPSEVPSAAPTTAQGTFSVFVHMCHYVKRIY